MKFLIDHRGTTDPALNLALEEYALRRLDIAHDYVILSVNQPCVVIGRHQNAYEEINLPALRQKGIPLLRRISGGGTVYHDPGNLNFSFITRYEKHKFNNYRFFNQPVIRALHSLGIDADLNGRNDIVIGDRKISGNAQFTSRDRMVSHGTLLLNARLNDLRVLLGRENRHITSRAIKSVRRPVANIQDFLSPEITISDLREAILRQLSADNDPPLPRHSFSAQDWEQIHQLAEEKYRRWEWNYGESPPFTYQKNGLIGKDPVAVRLEVQHGLITAAELEVQGKLNEFMARLSPALVNQRYEWEVIHRRLMDLLREEYRLHIDPGDLMKLLF